MEERNCDTVYAVNVTGQDGACAEQLTEEAHEYQSEGEAQTHYNTVECGRQNLVLGSIRLGTAEDDAVYYDQRQEQTKGRCQRRQECLHGQVDHGYEGCDDRDECCDTDLIRDNSAHRGNNDIGADENDGSRRAHADRILQRSGGCQRRAKTDRLHENRVIEDNARFQLFRKFHLAFPP